MLAVDVVIEHESDVEATDSDPVDDIKQVSEVFAADSDDDSDKGGGADEMNGGVDPAVPVPVPPPAPTVGRGATLS